jgi:hypothetical protein
MDEKSKPMEQGNEKQSGWIVFLETLKLIYESLPGQANDHATLALKL